jgi:hypothetical protein
MLVMASPLCSYILCFCAARLALSNPRKLG